MNINWRFPLEAGPQGYFDSNQTVEDAVKENIKMVLFTRPSERVVLGQYGIDIQKFLFEPNTLEKKSKIQSEIFNGINRWVRNVTVQKVTVVYPEELNVGHPFWGKINLDRGQILIVLQYSISSSNSDFIIPNQTLIAMVSPFLVQTP